MRLDPQSSEAWYARGALAYAQGQLDQAVEAYGRAVDLNPRYYTARVARATALTDSGRFPEAVAVLGRMLEDAPWDPQLNYLMAVSLDKTGDKAGAAKALQEAARLMASVPVWRSR